MRELLASDAPENALLSKELVEAAWKEARMCDSKWWQKYMEQVHLSPDFVRIAGTNHPVYEINPSGDNRYGPAVYVSSGLDTAAAEVGRVSLAHKRVFRVQSGEYFVFNQMRYCRDFPEERERLRVPRESGGYDACRALREKLECDSEGTISGIMYESTKTPDVPDLALWDPRNSEGLPSGFFGAGTTIDPRMIMQPGESIGGDLVNPDPF